MKKIILLAILVQIFNLSYAQFGEGSKDVIESWKNKTLVVLQYPNYDMYNAVVVEVAKEQWFNDKIELVDFTKASELKKRDDIVILAVKKYLSYENMPVICLSNSVKTPQEYNFLYDKKGYVYNYVQLDRVVKWEELEYDKKLINSRGLVLGLTILNNSTKERVKLLTELLFSTLEKFNNETEYEFKNITKNSGIYNTPENLNIVKNKTLLIEEKDLPRTNAGKIAITEASLKSTYKGKVKIVTEEELASAIKNKTEDVIYLHPATELSWPTYTIIDIAERKIIYCGLEKAKFGDASTVKMFERMLESIIP